jgi:predicted O-methyltransferase YrrM
MIDLNHCNEWQHRDPSNGLVFPWYTKSFLDELVTWELSDKTVLEIGLGASTIWWAHKALYVTAFETDGEWFEAVNKQVTLDKCNVFLAKKGRLIGAVCEIVEDRKFDIAVIDCEPIEYRDKAIEVCVSFLKPGGKLIIDNWDQPSVWIPNDETRALLAPYSCKIYKQSGHLDWQTAVFTKI